jgi:hypothetical protein
MTVYDQALTLEEVVNRIRNGKPFHWLVVHDGDRVFEVAVDISPSSRSPRPTLSNRITNCIGVARANGRRRSFWMERTRRVHMAAVCSNCRRNAAAKLRRDIPAMVNAANQHAAAMKDDTPTTCH